MTNIEVSETKIVDYKDPSRRKMASAQRVVGVEPIEGADRIEKIRVLGWQLVAQKNEFKPGDLCVYCEIDSLLPEHPAFEAFRDRKFRIRTIKLRGVISQGLALPLSHPYIAEKLGNRTVTEGEDLSTELGIGKYEIPVPAVLAGKVAGGFPTHLVPKTDELRVQSYVNVLDEFAGREVYITTKMDGTSFTAYYSGETFGVCSRNLELKPDDHNLLWQIASKYDLERILKTISETAGLRLAIQGEVCGPGIQNNPLGLKEPELYVFNVYDIGRQRYLDYADAFRLLSDWKLPAVPVEAANVRFEWTLDQLLEMAKGKYKSGKHREGIVIRPVVEQESRVLQGRLSVKAINNDYLLSGGN